MKDWKSLIVTPWNAECRIDVTKDDFVYNPRENEFWISETDTLFYLLDEVERRLKKDSIYVVKSVETEKKGFYPLSVWNIAAGISK